MKTVEQKIEDGSWMDEMPEEFQFWHKPEQAFYILIEIGRIADCPHCRQMLENDMICGEHEGDLQKALTDWRRVMAGEIIECPTCELELSKDGICPKCFGRYK